MTQPTPSDLQKVREIFLSQAVQLEQVAVQSEQVAETQRTVAMNLIEVADASTALAKEYRASAAFLRKSVESLS